MALTKALCCFNSKTAMYLEKTNLIITTIAILFNIFKLCIIPWGATSYSMEFLAVFNFTFLAVNLVFVFFFFMLRLKSMLNDSNYRKSLSICYFMIFISLLCFLFEILLMFFGLEDLYYYTGTYYASTDEIVVTDGEYFFAFFTIVPSVVFWFVIFMLWASECLRVAVKTSGSYEDYMNDNVEVVIVNRKSDNKDRDDNNKGEKIKEGENSAVKPKNNTNISITYA